MPADATRLLRAVERWGAAVNAQSAVTAQGLARYTGDVPTDEGELRRAIKAGPVRAGGPVSRWTMSARVVQAATTDRGARPHIIRPKRPGGVLVFQWGRTGGTAYLRHVNHPGNAPMRWWRPLLVRSWQQGLRLAARSVPFR